MSLAGLLSDTAVLAHPWVIGELALGNLSHRDKIIGLLNGLPQTVVADDAEVLRLIDQAALHGLGIGYVDAQLLAATRLTPDARLWSRDKRLSVVTRQLGLELEPTPPARTRT